MARKVFYSFHYVPDCWRASQVRNIGALEDNQPVRDNDWEAVTRGGDKAIEAWIAAQMTGRSCAVVLIGAGTARRKWIDHEIIKAWNDGKGLVGVHIHNLKNKDQQVSAKGASPFAHLVVGQTPLSSIVRAYDPPASILKTAHAHIRENLEAWVEEAIAIRAKY